jgi:hypothetical protein
MKTKLHYILFAACIASTALVIPSYAQEQGSGEYEVIDSERDKAERDKILYSPGEGESRYIPRNTATPAPLQQTKDLSSKETLKESDLKTGTTTMHQQKVKPDGNTHAPKSTEKQQQAQPKANDDAILSFNFLYYIIQKYKLQDIIID